MRDSGSGFVIFLAIVWAVAMIALAVVSFEYPSGCRLWP